MLPERALAVPVALRPFGPGDAARVRLLAGERAVAEATALIPHPYPDGAAEAWIAAQARDRAAGREYTYAVTLAADGLLVGAIGLRPAAVRDDNLGYWIGRDHWGRGYASAAARAVIALAFSLLDLDELAASHLARNAASGRVLEKCGLLPVRRERRDHRGVEEVFCVRAISRAAWEQSVAG